MEKEREKDRKKEMDRREKSVHKSPEEKNDKVSPPSVSFIAWLLVHGGGGDLLLRGPRRPDQVAAWCRRLSQNL